MKLITHFSRLFVGLLFIFSGLIKLNDPMGFAFKLNDYFAPDVLNLPLLDPWALQIALFVVIFEVVLGVALLLGFRPKFTVWMLLLMIVFFTFLTFYSAYFNKVTDCGCFGDAIPLTPWQSFYKDIVLLVFILLLFFNQKHIKPLGSLRFRFGTVALSALLCGIMAYWVLNHLPLKDFRPYAVGKNIEEGMKSAEELGLEGPTYETFYVLKNENTEEDREVSGTDYVQEKWYEKPEWKIDSDKTFSKKIKDGYEPPIHDFSITLEGEDVTWEVLDADKIALFISYDINKSSIKGLQKAGALSREMEQKKIPVLFLTASSQRDIDSRLSEVGTELRSATADGTLLKTIIRANPGLVILEKGTVTGKWHFNDFPSADKI